MTVLEQPVTHARRPTRFVIFGIAVLIAVSGLTARLFSMQLASAPGAAATQSPAAAVANGLTVADVPIPSTRGLIYDRAGRPLVQNVPTYAVQVVPADLPFSQRPAVVQRLSTLLGIPVVTINSTIDRVTGSQFDPVIIARNVPSKTASWISENNLALPGVEVKVIPMRNYVAGSLFTQIVGWTGQIDPTTYAALKDQGYLPSDVIGRTGVETTYESALRGTYGVQEVQKDATGKVIRTLATTTPARAGNSLVLTIDTKEQQYAQKALAWGLKTAHVTRGAIVVENPQTGEILAMVSLPTYDANLFSHGISAQAFRQLLTQKGQPLVNHAIGDIQPPGSTYKLVTGTGALGDGKLALNGTVLSKPYVLVGGTKFWEWNRMGWGPLNIKTGFGHSSDTFFYQLAGRLGIERLAYWAKQYGFGQPTGIDLPGEAQGLVPNNQWKMDALGQPIYPGETLQAGIGQGYDLSTPLQLLNAYAALANGGTLYQPQVVREIKAPNGTVIRPFKPKVLHKVAVPSWVLRTMRQAARTVITSRHTYNLVDMPIVIAGKTGTAEFGLRYKGVLPYHNWFVAFVPKNAKSGNVTKPDSQLAVVAYIYDAGTVGNAATEVVKYYLQLHFHIKRDYRLPQLLQRGNFYEGQVP